MYRGICADMTINEAVQARILDICNERNISVNKLCIMSGVTQSTVNNILSRKNSSPTILTIKRLCDGLDMTLTDFFNCKIFENIDTSI